MKVEDLEEEALAWKSERETFLENAGEANKLLQEKYDQKQEQVNLLQVGS